jgi:hypothetical protein
MATEEPAYKVALHEGAYEVREYPALIAAEVTVNGDRNEAAKAGFRLLAEYIFGGNIRRQGIAMTVPVVQTRSMGEWNALKATAIQYKQAGAWVIRFMMPHKYSLDTLPEPNDPRVQLTQLPPERFAVVRFSGLAGEAEVERQTADLTAFTDAHALHSAGPPLLARYNAPWTPWFMRRNEVMHPLQSTTWH